MDFRPDPIYEFPPFFTRQPNEDTWQAQLEQWQRVILAVCAHERQWDVSATSKVFANPRIQRELKPSVASTVLETMVKQGQAERTKTGVYVYAQKPAELAAHLTQWSKATGHSQTVLTIYELTEGELPGLDAFKDLDNKLLVRVVETMARRGDAAPIKENGEIVGLKLA